MTDAQIDAIGASGGLIGIVFAVAFLRSDGRDEPDTPRSTIAAYARHVADRIGVEHVALGSDFDSATIPAELRDAGLPRLLDALRDAGFSVGELRAIAWHNWRRVFERAWEPVEKVLGAGCGSSAAVDRHTISRRCNQHRLRNCAAPTTTAEPPRPPTTFPTVSWGG